MLVRFFFTKKNKHDADYFVVYKGVFLFFFCIAGWSHGLK